MALVCKLDRRSVVKFKGRPVELVREQYLRSDMSCQSALCSKCTLDQKCTLLPKDVTHYFMPFMDVAFNYLEILEFPEMRGIIFTQTLSSKTNSDGSKTFANKLNKIFKDPRKESIWFLNENNVDTYLSRNDNETLEHFKIRNIYNVAVWYSKHLDHQMPIILVTENKNIILKYENENFGVYVISLEQYLKDFWPELKIAHDIYESLTALLTMEPTFELHTGYEDYLPTDVLESGLKNGVYHEGKLKVSKHHAQDEAFVLPISASLNKTTKSDVLISGQKDRNRAIHGDVVYIEILPKSLWQGRLKFLGSSEKEGEQLHTGNTELMPTGRVVGIKQRNWRDYTACFPQNENFNKNQFQDRILVIPFDYRIPKIRIITRQAQLFGNERIVVRIDSWNTNSQYPNGHFVKSIGKIGDIETESMTLMVENNINIQAFPTRVMNEMPSETFQHEVDLQNRRDLRNSHLICSIDPKGCEDVDDALSIRYLENGLTEFGVHIADVTHFVLPNSFTDMEAKARATTVYLADKRYDMLPAVLSSNLCSLLSNVDRYAVSVLWTLDKNCNITDVWFGRTIIKSSYKLTYELAQEIIDGDSVKEFSEQCPEIKDCDADTIKKKFDELKMVLVKLTNIAHVLKKRRVDEGALELESSEVQFEFQEISKQSVHSVKVKQALDIHETVAESMIFANHWVGKKIYESFPTHALLRRHPEPRQEQFDHLRLLAEYKEFSLNTLSNRQLAESLEHCIDPHDSLVNKIMRFLVVPAMSPASYFSTGSFNSDEYFHYGLALKYYTHFTSPIRRYADILVHRLLLATDKANGADLPGNKALQDICEHINDRHVAAKNVQWQSQALFETVYFSSLLENDDHCKTDAVIYAIRSNGVKVYISQYGIKGPVYLINKEKKVANLKSGNLEWTSGTIHSDKFSISVESVDGDSHTYNLFDHITVHIQVVTAYAHAPNINLTLINYKPQLKCQTISTEQNIYKKLNLQVKNGQEKSKPWDTSVKKQVQYDKTLYSVIESLRDFALKS